MKVFSPNSAFQLVYIYSCMNTHISLCSKKAQQSECPVLSLHDKIIIGQCSGQTGYIVTLASGTITQGNYRGK